MKFSRATALAILGAMAAEASADCDCAGPGMTKTVTETSTVHNEKTVTETHTVNAPGGNGNAVKTSGQATITGGTGPEGIGGASGSLTSQQSTATGTHESGGGGGGGKDGGKNGGGNGGFGDSNGIGNPIPPFKALNHGRSTSCDYAEGRSTVYEYPAAAATAAGNYTCDNVVYEETEIIMNIILSLEVTIIEELQVFKTVTQTLVSKPTHTPAQPPPPALPWLIPPGIGNSTFLPNQTYHFPSNATSNSTGNFTGPATPLSTANAPGRVHPIDVSSDGRFMYASNHLNATIGESLQFEFQGTNISVFETTLENPCTPKHNGFRTGFNQTSANTTLHLDRSMKITDHKPRYFFCGGASKECSKETVFAVNADIKEWSTLEETLKSNRTSEKVPPMIPELPRREPVTMPKREPQIPGRRSLTWWS